jgi:hypothetical protein
MNLFGHRPADYATMAESLLLAITIEIGLRLMSVRALVGWLDRLTGHGRILARPSYRLDQFATAAYRLLPFDSTCLRRSLVLYGLLRRRGSAPRLCVGVKKDGAALSAHAWIECAGVADENELGTYLELLTRRAADSEHGTRRQVDTARAGLRYRCEMFRTNAPS